MKILSIAFKDLLIILKDRKALIQVVLMPIVLILVLGMALSSMFNPGESPIKKFEIAVVDKDKGEQSKDFMNFLNSEEIKKFIGIKEMDENKALENIKSGKLAALIIIPEGYTRAVDSGEKANFKIYEDPGSETQTKLLESLVSSYTSAKTSIMGAASAADMVFKAYNLNGNMIIPKLMEKAENDKKAVDESNIKAENKISAIQYYSAAMLAMYILFTALLGTSSMLEEREQGTLERLGATCVSKTSLLLGKLTGVFVIGVLDVSVLILFTNLVFKVQWGESLLGIMILSAAMVFGVCGFSIFIATVFKSSKAVDSTAPAIIMVMSFLGGSMIPYTVMPDIIQKLSKVLINNWALRGYLDLMMGSGINSILLPAAVMCLIGSVLLSAGVLRLRGRIV